MMVLTRSLKFQLPMMRGRDVLAVQRRLRALSFNDVGQPDGVFGPSTDEAVRAFQASRGLKVDGIVGPVVAGELFVDDSTTAVTGVENPLLAQTRRLCTSHRRVDGSVRWCLTAAGVSIDDTAPEGTPGEPKTVKRVWNDYGISIRKWGQNFGVPVELIVATICTETSGRAEARREEPGYVSDMQTPHRVSTGLMQTLISTARDTLRIDGIDTDWLLVPDNSIRAGTAYIAAQATRTLFDPPVVACAYNAGGVYKNDGAENRWRMRQYPIGTGHHADRYVKWFNDCFKVLVEVEKAGAQAIREPSYYELLKQIKPR